MRIIIVAAVATLALTGVAHANGGTKLGLIYTLDSKGKCHNEQGQVVARGLCAGCKIPEPGKTSTCGSGPPAPTP